MKKNDYNALEDGSLLYDEPAENRSPYYKVDPDNPNRLIPIMEPCMSRRIELRTLSCGRKRSDFYCIQLSKRVSIRECSECQIRT